MSLDSLYPEAKVDELLALEFLPEYMKGHDMSNAIFLRFKDECTMNDEELVVITEAACREHDIFLWRSSRLPITYYPRYYRNGRLNLPGCGLPDGEGRLSYKPLFQTFDELIPFEFTDGLEEHKLENGDLVTVLKPYKYLDVQAWRKRYDKGLQTPEESNGIGSRDNEGRSVMVALGDMLKWIARHF